MQLLHLLAVLAVLVFHLQLPGQQLLAVAAVAVVLIGLIVVLLEQAVLAVAVLADKHQEQQLLMVLREQSILAAVAVVEVLILALEMEQGAQVALALSFFPFQLPNTQAQPQAHLQ
jgi:hypothetical protein